MSSSKGRLFLPPYVCLTITVAQLLVNSWLICAINDISKDRVKGLGNQMQGKSGQKKVRNHRSVGWLVSVRREQPSTTTRRNGEASPAVVLLLSLLLGLRLCLLSSRAFESSIT